MTGKLSGALSGQGNGNVLSLWWALRQAASNSGSTLHPWALLTPLSPGLLSCKMGLRAGTPTEGGVVSQARGMDTWSQLSLLPYGDVTSPEERGQICSSALGGR